MTENYIFGGRSAHQWMELSNEYKDEATDMLNEEAVENFRSRQTKLSLADDYMQYAQIAKDGGTVYGVALFNLEGEFITSNLVETTYGMAWILPNGTWFNQSSARKHSTRIKNNAKKGYCVGAGYYNARLVNGKVIYDNRDFVARDEQYDEKHLHSEEIYALEDSINICETVSINHIGNVYVVADRIINKAIDLKVASVVGTYNGQEFNGSRIIFKVQDELMDDTYHLVSDK